MARALYLQSGGPEFKSCFGNYLDLFLGGPVFNSSATLVNGQLVCLLPFGILEHVMFYLKYLFLFSLFHYP